MVAFALLCVVVVAACTGLLLLAGPIHAKAEVQRPNIVLIMTDDQTLDSLPVMRNLLSYPHGSWINFTNAFASHSICSPSRATLLTGQYSQTHGVLGNTMGRKLDDDTTLAVWLDDAGYRTGLIGKYVHSYPSGGPDGQSSVPGWDYFYNRAAGVDVTTDRAVNFITDADSPFFLWLAYRAPHKPAKPPARYQSADVYIPPVNPNFDEADMSDKPKQMQRRPRLSQQQIAWTQSERLASQRELLAIDDGVQRVVDTLDDLGELDNTLIIFISDHGFSFGAHRRINKQCPYDECSRVPLLMRFPGQNGNRQEDHVVSNVDLAATIAEYAGVTPYIPQDGRSLMPLLTHQAVDWEDAILIGQPRYAGAQYTVRVPGWVYSEYFNGEKELYDMVNDPYELDNLANFPPYAEQQALLAAKLHDLLTRGPQSTAPPTGPATP